MNDTAEARLTVYEEAQVSAIAAWKLEAPGVATRALAMLAAPVVWLAQKIVPEAAVQGALHGASAVASNLSDTGDLLLQANVRALSELRSGSLERSDTLANTFHNWAVGMAAVEGGIAGGGGLAAFVVDIPATLVLALRTIHKIGQCYGYECDSDRDQELVLSILSAAGANSMAEKVEALTVLRIVQVTVSPQTSSALTAKAATISVNQVARQLGINLTKRKALQAIPGIGAAVAAGVNGAYVRDIGWAARRAFQERWLLDNGKLLEPVS